MISSSYNNLNNRISYREWVLVLSITVVYALVSLYNLGSFTAKQMWYGDLPNKSITIKFNQPQQLSEISMFACTVNGQFQVIGINAANGLQEALVSQDDSKTIVNYYCGWRIFPIHPPSKFSTLQILVKEPQFNISKLLIRDSKQQIIYSFQVTATIDQKLDDLTNVFVTSESDVVGYQKFTRFGGAPYLAHDAMIFDENMYALMAYHYLEHQPIFNTAHPQLGMLLTSAGISIWGMNPFGWRFMEWLAGVLLVPILYLFARKLFNSQRVAIIATLLLCLDFMHFTLSRVAVIEPFVTLFLVLEYYFLYRYMFYRSANYSKSLRNLFYAGIFFGLALACKWTALFSLLMVLFCFIHYELLVINRLPIRLTKRIVFWLLIWLIIPFVIYFLSYIPFLMIVKPSQLWATLLDLQQIMWSDHTKLMVTKGGVGVPWWSWPLDLHPMSAYFWYNMSSLRSHSIVLMGNPAIYWLGIIVLPLMIWKFIKTKRIGLGFLLLAFAAQYLPYIFIQRINWIYYFYSATPFLFMLIAYFLSNIMDIANGKYTKLVTVYLMLCVVLFIAFYPVISGAEINRAYVYYALHWFKGWVF